MMSAVVDFDCGCSILLFLYSSPTCLLFISQYRLAAQRPILHTHHFHLKTPLSHISPPMAKTTTPRKPNMKTPQNRNPNPAKQEKLQQSWVVFRSILTCKHLQQQPENQKNQQNQKIQEPAPLEENTKKTKKMKCSGSLCNNTKVMHRAEPLSSSSPEESKKKVLSSPGSGNESSRSMRVPLISEQSTAGAIVSSSNPAPAAGSFRSGMPFRRFSGCYECTIVVDPVLGITRDHSLRSSICSCPHCGEIFTKSENLELHQAVRHAGINSYRFLHHIFSFTFLKFTLFRSSICFDKFQVNYENMKLMIEQVARLKMFGVS